MKFWIACSLATVVLALSGCLPHRLDTSTAKDGMMDGDGAELSDALDVNDLEEAADSDAIPTFFDLMDDADRSFDRDEPVKEDGNSNDTSQEDVPSDAGDLSYPLPKSEISNGPPKIGNSAKVTFEFQCIGSGCESFSCQLDEAPWTNCTSPTQFDGVKDGVHTFRVVAKRGELVETPENEYSFKVDTRLPSTIFLSTPMQETTQLTAEFLFSCDEIACTFSCNLDFGDWFDCTSPLILPVPAGEHTLRVKSLDVAGNSEIGSADFSWATRTWLTVSTGGQQTCAISDNGRAWCWGDNFNDLLGVGPMNEVYNPAPVISDNATGIWSDIQVGGFHICGLNATSAYCWGQEGAGQLGLGPESGPRSSPAQLSLPATWKRLSTSIQHSCGIDGNDMLYCWGSNSNGELGVNDKEPRDTPTPVTGGPGDGKWTSVSVGWSSACAISATTKSLWCWGANGNGQLGLDDNDERLTPTKVDDQSWSRVDVGNGYACAIRADAVLHCWGANSNGQLGVDDKQPRSVPTAVAGNAKKWEAISTGATHTCGIDSDQGLWCWGNNDSGRAGLGSDPSDRILPTKIATPARWIMIDAGLASTCGISEDGALWCWGLNTYGVLGIGDTKPVSTPTRVRFGGE
ncbi:MAG: hypothetical protein KC609_22235 [Myxococcales bacterium]|nr:hypothetical protein [Myxococcales bacterium]